MEKYNGKELNSEEMEKPETKTKDNSKPDSKHDEKEIVSQNKVRTWLILDIIAFLLISIALSGALLTISSSLSIEKNDYTKYTSSDEYIEYTMQSILSSTIPETRFNVSTERRIANAGKTVEYNLEFDLLIRSQDTVDNSTLSSLEVFEETVKTFLDIAFDRSEYVFIFMLDDNDNNVDFELLSESNSEIIYITNIQNPPSISSKTEPVFYKQDILPNSILSDLSNRSYNINLYIINGA